VDVTTPHGEGWAQDATGQWVFVGDQLSYGAPYPTYHYPDPNWPAPPTTPPGASRTHRHRPSATTVLSLLIVVFLALGAGIYVVRTVGNHPGGPGAMLTAAVSSTVASHTADVTIASSASVTGRSVSVSGSGALDFGENSSEFHLNVKVLDQTISEESISVGGTVYVNSPGVSTLFPGKSWMSIDLGAGATTPFGGTSSTASSDGLDDNPAGMLELLQQEGGTVTPLGPSTVTGVPVQGYTVTFSPAQIQSLIAKAALPQWMRNMLSAVKTSGIDDHVYVDSTGHLRLVTMAFSESVTGSRPITVNQSIQLSGYGAPVSISAPPADAVVPFQTFLRALKQLGNPGSVTTA
jgi:hypothetical protein